MIGNYIIKTNTFIGVPYLIPKVFNTVHQECLTLFIKSVKHC